MAAALGFWGLGVRELVVGGVGGWGGTAVVWSIRWVGDGHWDLAPSRRLATSPTSHLPLPPPAPGSSVAEQYLGKRFQEPVPLPPWQYKDYLGWGEQGDGRLYCGVYVQVWVGGGRGKGGEEKWGRREVKWGREEGTEGGREVRVATWRDVVQSVPGPT